MATDADWRPRARFWAACFSVRSVASSRPRRSSGGIEGLLRSSTTAVPIGSRAALDSLLRSAGVRAIRLPPRSPNLNAFAERFVRSIKEECLNRMIILGERRLRYVIDEYVEHYHLERPHQGIGNVLIQPSEVPRRWMILLPAVIGSAGCCGLTRGVRHEPSIYTLRDRPSFRRFMRPSLTEAALARVSDL